MGTHSPAHGESSSGRAIPVSQGRPITRAGSEDLKKVDVKSFILSIVAIAGLALMPSTVTAQSRLPERQPGEPAKSKPGILGKIGIDQRLNQHIPLDLPFVDENGKDVRLGDYFGKRPVLLAMVYYECPMLCTQVLNGVTGALKVINFDVGKEFDIVAVSINPREGPGLAAQKKQAYVQRYGRPQTADGWHFLTGREENIQTPRGGGGLPLRLRRRDQAIRARRRRGADHAEGSHREVLLRHRVLAARHSLRDRRSVGGKNRIADR